MKENSPIGALMLKEIIEGAQRENRFAYEEVVWLLLFGTLPTAKQLEGFMNLLNVSASCPTILRKI